MDNPVLVEVTRGSVVESRHRGAFAIVRADGTLAAQAGDVSSPVFPRSAIKAFQALPLIVSGAADATGFTPPELALACASHGGEPEHAARAKAMLDKAGLSEADLECGAHWPMWAKAGLELGRSGEKPTALHNNCSGKHAGMLALVQHLGAPTEGYVDRDHPVQTAVRKAMSDICDYDLDNADWGIDGCSVPTWAVPLQNLAHGFARFCSGATLEAATAQAAKRIISAATGHPYLVAGTKRFCTGLMRRVPRVFVKTGAEGVFCGGVPHLGLGLALKCDDGGTRAAECVMAHLLECLDGFDDGERKVFHEFGYRPVRNRKALHVGDIRPATDAFEAVRCIA